ncbi:DUF3825 domain-containing protein [Atopobium sp. oral taxon 810]|uniref:DUF3825 domain-containing protein n=1 Tax=Atopobium sp. oral taxon 810 TaxID=712158 RepID=UPI0003977BD3|nr:DUF3825 domain-containing protein [Atopobium sp. oral taxon 810]ERI05740.1 hypothetical protein HMPREF9069_00679 [Atopobium sp. oral taxon 810 str. F0209]
MTSRISTGNALYLYRLFLEAFGQGKQIFLPRIEEVLQTDGIAAYDLDCESVQELLEKLEFVSLTKFKGGRIYATLQTQPKFDEALAALTTAAEDEAPKKGGKPWKRKKTQIKPARPVHREPPKPLHEELAEEELATPEPVNKIESEETPAKKSAQDEMGVAKTTVQGELEQSQAVDASTGAAADAPAKAGAAAGVSAKVETEIEATAKIEAKTENETDSEVKAEVEAKAEVETITPLLTPQPSIHLTIVSKSGADAGSLEEEQTLEEENILEEDLLPRSEHITPEPNSTSQVVIPAHAVPTQSAAERALPKQFWPEVRCPEELMSKLALALPLGADVLSTLEEDWQVARATGNVSYTRKDAHFPLRYHDTYKKPIEVYLKRSNGLNAGKRWIISDVQTHTEHITAPEPIESATTPRTTQDFWMAISATSLAPYRRRNLALELSRHLHFESWTEFCQSFSSLAAHEAWGETNEDDLPILREYLSVNFVRALEQNRIVASADGKQKLWNTGLVNTAYQEIFCLMNADSAAESEPAEFFAALTATDSRLASWGTPPAPASYISSLEDLYLPYETTLLDNPRAHITTEACTRALARAKASFRELAPIWDPQTSENYLLLPLEKTTAEQKNPQVYAALIAKYQAGRLCPLKTLCLRDAYACARVVSAQMPSWLSGTLEA